MGLFCINLRFMHVFLRLRLVLILLSFDYGFECVEPSFRRKARSWSQAQSRELAKQAQKAQYGRSKVKTCGSRQEQNAAYEERSGQNGQRPPQLAHGGHHGPWWPIFPRLFHFPFMAFRFPAQFFNVSYSFGFKRRMYLAYWVGRIYSKNSLSFSKNSIDKEEGRRRLVKPKRHFWWRIERSALKHCMSFLISFALFHFLQS